ncbi:MAG: transposase [Candidatus Limnocylindrales bacterium]
MIRQPEALPVLEAFAPAFSQLTIRRFVVLLVAAVLTPGRHTVANLLRTLGVIAPGHRIDYQRVLSRAPWSGL